MKIKITESGSVLSSSNPSTNIFIIGSDGKMESESLVEVKNEKDIAKLRDKVVKDIKAKKKLPQ